MWERELRTIGAGLIKQAKVLRDGVRVLDDEIVALPPEPRIGSTGFPLWAALVCLRDEMILVYLGTSQGVTVLDDEIACVERLLPNL